MAILKRDNEHGSDGRTASGDGALSIIALGMTVTGDIESNGVVKIEGHVEGTIRAARQVLIGRQGSVKGNVITREAIVGGRIDGNVSAAERAEVQGTAIVSGDVHTKSIVIVEGAQVNGHIQMDEHMELEVPGELRPPAMPAFR
ncbi:MAG: hypothetical protein NVS4B3_01580 [Gemmatimonadaceae bacterium]